MRAVCRIEDLTEGEGHRVILDGIPEPVAVFLSEGSVYVIGDTCSHQDASLADGWVEGCFVECPLHASSFDLRTGMPTCAPAKVGVRAYPSEVVDGMVMVEFASVAAA